MTNQNEDYTEDDLWDMDDSDLEASFKEAIANQQSPDIKIEEVNVDTQIEEEQDEEDLELPSNSEDSGDDNETSDEILDADDDNESTSEPGSADTDDTDDTSEDNTDETEGEDPDGGSTKDEEESPEDVEDVKPEEQPTREYTFKANGKDYNFSSEEIVDQFPKIFGKAMDYTKKMQAIRPWRKTIDALEEAKLSHTDISLMIDVLGGDKEAITEVLKRTGTDTLELDTEADSGYITKDYGRDESALAISDIVDEISNDVEYATTQNILSKEWDERSWETITKNPEMIKQLHTDVKSGMYKTLQPIAEKLKVYGGGAKPDLEYYKEAAQQHFAKTAQQNTFNEQKALRQQKADDKEKQISEKKLASEEKQARLSKAKAQSDKRVATKKASTKRKAAATTKSASADRVTDYLDDSDEKFDDWYKKLQDSM